MTALEPDQSLLHYRLVEKLGEGGMGVVWRATDTKLGREVAIKVLPPETASDEDRLARFEREARTLASLHHPHIASLFGLEKDGDLRFLVMELVEGEDLARRIGRGAVPVDEAIEIARQIAEGLEDAHARGIVHRDLKPANIRLTPGGKVKVLDFGLAKAVAADPSSNQGDPSLSPTMTAATRAGIIMGTAAYMSPEQARGKPVDHRTDVWAFGVVLYEMLSGRRAFTGDDVSELIASVIKDEPSWSKLPSDLPPVILRLLRRCLVRDPRQRLQAIGEARIVLESPLEEPLAGSPAGSKAASAPRPSYMRALLTMGAVLLTAIGAWSGWALRPVPEPPLTKLLMPVGSIDMSSGRGYAISPDSTKVAFITDGQLWIRDLDQVEARPVPGTEGATHPFWSPDSARLGYAAGSKLFKVSATGMSPAPIADVTDSLSGAGDAAWLNDGRIIYTTGYSGLLSVSSTSGKITPLLEPLEEEADFHDAARLPDDRGILFTAHHVSRGVDSINVFDGQQRKTILRVDGQRVTRPVYSPTGHILFMRSLGNPGIWALPFSLASLEPTGDPFLVSPILSTPSVSDTGTLIHLSNDYASGLSRLVWVDRSGKIVERIQPEGARFQMPSPCLSPDGKRIGLATQVDGAMDFWVHELDRGTRTRITSGNKAFFWFCGWSPDGAELLYSSGVVPEEFEVRAKRIDGVGESRLVVAGSEAQFVPGGNAIVYVMRRERWDIKAKLFGPPEEEILFGADEREWAPAVSPDGRFVAYASSESGQSEIYLRFFPDTGSRWQVSQGGGQIPKWSPRGDEIFFLQDQDLMSVSFSAEPSPRLGQPVKLFRRPNIRADRPLQTPDGYDVSLDGRRFLILEEISNEADSQQLVVVQNWFSEFRKEGDGE